LRCSKAKTKAKDGDREGRAYAMMPIGSISVVVNVDDDAEEEEVRSVQM